MVANASSDGVFFLPACLVAIFSLTLTIRACITALWFLCISNARNIARRYSLNFNHLTLR